MGKADIYSLETSTMPLRAFGNQWQVKGHKNARTF